MRRWILAAVVLLMAAGGASADVSITDINTVISESGSCAIGDVYRWNGVDPYAVDMHYSMRTRQKVYTTTYYRAGFKHNYYGGYGGADFYNFYGPLETCLIDCNHTGAPYSMVGGTVECRDNNIDRLTTIHTGIITACSGTWSHVEYAIYLSPAGTDEYTVSGSTCGVTSVGLYLVRDSVEYFLNSTELDSDGDSYSFKIVDGEDYIIIFSDSAYYDFTCTGNEVVNYDICLWVYGYTCGIEHIKLWKDDGGWVLEDTYYQATIGVNSYEMPIESGNDYKLNFSDGHEYLFSCIGDHVLYNWDRCPWAYPPNGDPVPIVIYVGYDNRIVLLQDAHGNFIEHSQIAVYDQTDDIYLQKWTDNPEGYLVLTARFDTDHDVQIAVRTFDSVYTTTTVYPMNGTAENLTWTNWTIPIMYNIQIEPVDTYNVPLFDVFCGLAEYTPINPLSFWGMDFNRGYVSVTNCSGFSRCDIIAEKGGYQDFEITGLNWTRKSAMVKNYFHEIVMVKE